MSDLLKKYEEVNVRLYKLIDIPKHSDDSLNNDRRWGQIHKIKLNLITLIQERSLSENISPGEYEWRVEKAFEVVNDIKSSLTKTDPFEDKNKTQHWSKNPQQIWFHISDEVLQGQDKENEPQVDQSSLLEATSDYLSNSWMQHDYIDWILLDSLIYETLRDYREAILMGTAYGDINWKYIFHFGDAKKLIWTELLAPKAVFTARYIIPITVIAALYYFDLEKPSVIAGIIYALYLVFRLIFWPKRNSQKRELELQKNKSIKILERIAKIYSCCCFPILSPGIIKKLLYDGTEEGCIFKGVVYALVDSIFLRNPVLLKPEFIEKWDLDIEDQIPDENDDGT